MLILVIHRGDACFLSEVGGGGGVVMYQYRYGIFWRHILYKKEDSEKCLSAFSWPVAFQLAS